MNRFEYTAPELPPQESLLLRERNVRLYDGDIKTSFEGGELSLTSHRLFWGRPGYFDNGQICIALPLQLIRFVEEEAQSAFSFSRNRKIILHVYEPSPDRNEGPQLTSSYNFIKVSFREGFSTDILSVLSETLNLKKWEIIEQVGTSQNKTLPQIKLRTGIVGIERNLQEKLKAADESINVAFQDLSKLMTMAKDMVRISQNISTKIREKQGFITEDETVTFKSYLLSLGIDDPVTRDGFKSDNQYYLSLAKQICDILVNPIEEVGGMMVLTDAYCRVNRARGLELLSPDDVLHSCRLMATLGVPLKLYEFDSGVKVLQLVSMEDDAVIDATSEFIIEKGSVTAEELAQHLGVSVVLAKERMLRTEKSGKCCRDDSIEGLKFYPNLFLTRED